VIINGKSYEFNALLSTIVTSFFVVIGPKFLPLLYSEVSPFCLVMFSLFFCRGARVFTFEIVVL
jgi:hypothetical protein